MKSQATRTQRKERKEYARTLSRMTRADRLLARAINRARKRPKAGFRECGKVAVGARNICPKEWR